jgi:hypothetical protein
VTIPANAECSIQTVKSFDRQLLAASGNEKPVVKAHKPLALQHRKSILKRKHVDEYRRTNQKL